MLAYFTSWTSAKEDQFLAYSLDGGQSFIGYNSNPVMDLDRHNFRDPKVIFHEETGKYVAAVTLFDDQVTFYTSSDLLYWERVSTWTAVPGVGDIECPQLMRIPRRRSATDRTLVGTDSGSSSAWMLMLSTPSGGPGGGSSAVKYIVGDFNGTVFTPSTTPTSGQNYTAKMFDFGPDVYATAFYTFQTQAYVDGAQDAVSHSWATNLRYSGETPTCASENWRHVSK